MPMQEKYNAKKEDVKRIAELAGMEFVEHENKEQFEKEFVDGDLVFGKERVKQFLNEMANVAFSASEDEFAEFAAINRNKIREMADYAPEVAEMLVLCYRVGISNGSSACMNDLGAMYYMGDLVEQDYQKAAELYEMAADAGCYQSVINLGYIYEYGRTGEADHMKAYQWYSYAAALNPSSEAVYKLGDMYSQGKAIPRDKKKAYNLYEHSLELARNIVEAAQPAIRIARMLIDPEAPSYGVQPNLERALMLYQQAESGLRIDIANGQYYYRKRLAEAIEGQEKARSLIDDSDYMILD